MLNTIKTLENSRKTQGKCMKTQVTQENTRKTQENTIIAQDTHNTLKRKILRNTEQNPKGLSPTTTYLFLRPRLCKSRSKTRNLVRCRKNTIIFRLVCGSLKSKLYFV